MAVFTNFRSPQHPTLEWQSAYQQVLTETDKIILFKCIEVAEAKLLMRRETLSNCEECEAERAAIGEALRSMGRIKRTKLNFRP